MSTTVILLLLVIVSSVAIAVVALLSQQQSQQEPEQPPPPIEAGKGGISEEEAEELKKIEEDPSLLIENLKLCPPGWKVGAKNYCYDDAAKHPKHKTVHFVDKNDSLKTQFALEWGIEWPQYGVTMDMMCPDDWVTTGKGPECISAKGINNPNEGNAKFSNWTDERKTKWAKDKSIPWTKYGVPLDVLCPEAWSYLPATGECSDPSKVRGNAKFNSGDSDEHKSSWARENQTPWIRFGITPDVICPDNWTRQDDGWCVDPDKTRESAKFNERHTDKMKLDWALNNQVIWSRYGATEDKICPDEYSLQSDRWCKYKNASRGGAKFNAGSNREAWALDNQTPWNAFKVPKERLCPDGWTLQDDGWCADPKGQHGGAKFNSGWSNQKKKDWANARNIKWTFVGA